VRTLKQRGSWTGRIHIHKLLFIADVLELAEPPFEFELYQYGPYSFELDAVVAQMEVFGYIEKVYPKPGYGPQYLTTDLGNEEADQLDKPSADAIRRVADHIARIDSGSLERIATCMWVERRERPEDENAITARVRKLKPRYDERQVRASLLRSRRLTRALTT
jgi:uncharacterized protein YwgA